ncbi:hypothetical protein HAHI6034_01500 [Hathewaya histolytica]|uniref:Uncharacterized protein n=1 Tax=Hathewaya histolytica TaxID=1498 RepID=A0A4U9R244_HATHI|nr:hypothetical protein [Hathewaya histolytica]VTQ83993.1 Uncharacterised protein [Hathewaya histolytica]
MSTLALNRSYELQMPSSFVDVDRDEMEYVDGGFYISNQTLKGVLISAGVNPVGATLIGLGAWKLAGLITAKSAAVGAKLGAFGGPFTAAIGSLVSAAIGGGAALTIANAVIQGKGINVGLMRTKSGVPYWVDISIQ